MSYRQKFGKEGDETIKRELRDGCRGKFAILFIIQIKICTYTLYIHITAELCKYGILDE